VDGQPRPGQTAGGSVGGGTKAIQPKGPDTLQQPAASRPRVAEVRLLRKAGEHASPLNAGERSESPAHAEGRARTQLAPTPARMMNILEAEGEGETAARLASPHHEAGGHPPG
jgi:hypothetical protein